MNPLFRRNLLISYLISSYIFFPWTLGNEASKKAVKIGDRVTSDVVVRLRTDEGRDHWFYCHSEILTKKSKYFADRLSDDWPTCQILDSRYCVEVYCQEPEFNFHVNTLRLLYSPEPHTWHGVRNALGILQVAIHLGCPQMARACMEYIEAVPWEETDEEEILRTVPSLGPQYEQILARLQPVDKTAVTEIFISAIRFAMSSSPASMKELKSSAQEQIEYMLTEDDDAPLISLDDGVVKSKVKKCAKDLLTRFDNLIEERNAQELKSILGDLSWVCQILNKMEMMKDLVYYWVETSFKIALATEKLSLEAKVKVVEVTWKVLEAIGFGNVILPAMKRLHVVKVWLPFVQNTRVLVERGSFEDEDEVSSVRMDGEIWLGLESAFVSMILTLPLADQADILAEWLRCENIRYPDLTEAFEVWCYRSKVARRRITAIDATSNVESQL